MAEHGLTDELLAFIEIPKGSRNKYEYDEGIGAVILDRFLSSSMVYPTVCVSEPTFPGCVIAVKPIALFVMREEKGEDDKVVCVPTHDPGWNTAETLDDILVPAFATVREAAALILLRSARSLHDPVEGQEGGHHQLSHLSCPFDRIEPASSAGWNIRPKRSAVV